MATQIITRNASGSVPTVSTGADINRGATLSATDYDQNLVNLRSAVDTALSGVALTMSSANPLMDGPVSPGSSSSASRSDHRHPSDSTKADIQTVGTFRTNLGSPTVVEQAIFQAQYNNKFQFNYPTLVEDSTNGGSTWTTSALDPLSNTMKDMMVGSGTTGGFTIVRGNSLRLTWDNSVSAVGYVYLQHFYAYMITAIHTLRILIEFHDGTSWSTLLDQGGIAGWPTHCSGLHGNKAYLPNCKVRVSFIPTWSTDSASPYYTTGVTVYSIEWWGGYPSGKRDLFITDRNKGATFPGAVNASQFISYGGIYSTTSVGIGTTTPQDMLQVKGAGKSISLTDINISNTSYNTFKVGASAQNIFFLGVGAETAYSAQMFINGQTGNVGIGAGAATPAVKLHVSNGSSGGAPYANTHLIVENSGRSIIQLLSPNNSDAFLMFGSPAASNRAFIGYANSTSATPDQMQFLTSGTYTFTAGSGGSGYIGIGTSLPNTKVEINGSYVANKGQLYINTADHSYIALDSSILAKDVGIMLNRSGTPKWVVYLQSNSNDLNFYDTTNRVTFQAGGNVGIGTTAPNYKLEVNGSFAATTKSFVIDHPTKKGKKLRYGSLEGPENGVYVRGKLKDKFVIHLPEYWTKLVDQNSITVSLTPIGQHQKFYVESIIDNKIFIKNDNPINKKIECFYVVYGERVDVEKLTVEFKA